MDTKKLEPFTAAQLTDAIYWALKMAPAGTKQAYYQGNEHRRDLAAKMLARAISARLTHVTMQAPPIDYRPPMEHLLNS